MASKNPFRPIVKLLVIVACLIPFASLAEQQDIQNFGDTVPSRDQLIEALAPESEPSSAQARGVGMSMSTTSYVTPNTPTESASAPSPPSEPVTEKPKIVSLGSVKFAFDSHVLADEAIQTLNHLGEALSDPKLEQSNFRIEGHTDSIGSASYNLDLSERRAKSVKNYLVTSLGINPDRLFTEGKGENEPINKTNPKSAENRRVQIVNLQ